MDSSLSLRSRITRAFNDQELRDFCFDHFPAVYTQFATTMTTGQMIGLLLDYCVRHQAGDALLTALEQARPGLIGADRDALLASLDATRLDEVPSTATSPRKGPALVWWVVGLLVVIIVSVGLYRSGVLVPGVQPTQIAVSTSTVPSAVTMLPSPSTAPTEPLTQPTATDTSASGQCDTSISFGETMQCALPHAGIEDYSFEAAKDDRLLVVVTRAVESTNQDRPVSFMLARQDVSGASICGASGERNAEALCTIPETGTYALMVESRSAADNSYRIFVQRLNAPSHATPIRFGVPFTGTIIRAAQIDSYTIEVANEGPITTHVTIDQNDNSLQPWFLLYDQDRNAPVCEGEATQHAEKDCNLVAAGRYTLLVGSRRRNTFGPYTGTATVNTP